MYGMSAFGVASNLGIERDAAKLIIERYFTRFPGSRSTWNRRALAKRQGYVRDGIWPALCCRKSIHRMDHGAPAPNAAINAPMQGTAADLIKLAMIAVPSGSTPNNSERGW